MTNIETLQTMYERLETLRARYTEAYITHKQQNGEREQDGKKEKLLWDELYYLGKDCPAGVILKGLYPEMFEMDEAIIRTQKDIQDMEVKEFGFKGNAMTLLDLVNLVKKVVNKEV